MQANGWRAPDYNQLLLTRDIKHQFSAPKGGAIDVACFFVDPYGAADWCSAAQEDRYLSTFEVPPDWIFWIAGLISRHLKDTYFLQDQIDVIGLGAGDGRKETALCDGLLQTNVFQKLRCFFVDISPTLAIESHGHFVQYFGESPLVESNWILGNFFHLPRYTNLFYNPDDVNRLRVGCVLGGIFGVILHEVGLIEQSLRAFKTGDLVIVDVCLGFAPPDQKELIQKQDPSFNTTHGLKWIAGVIRRNRPDLSSLRFQYEVKRGLSTIPDTYTIETLATIDEQAVFSVYRKHRYSKEGLLGTFAKLGWRLLESKHYGRDDRQLISVFVKE